MKYVGAILSGCCAALVAADFTGYGFSESDIDSILRARSIEPHLSLLPRSYRFERRAGGMAAHGHPMQRPGLASQRPSGRVRAGFSQNGIPYQNGVPYQNGKPGGQSGKADQNGPGEPAASYDRAAKNNNGRSGSHKAIGMIQAKGPAAIHVSTPTDFKDKYFPIKDKGGLFVEHDHSVTAGGVVSGSPPPDGPTQHPDDHPLKAKGQARAVMGQVTAPVGGSGNIQIHTPEMKDDIRVPGGTTITQSAMAKHPEGKAKVVASVTNGGGVRIAAGPNQETVEQ